MKLEDIEKIRHASRVFVRELGFFHRHICGDDLTLAQGHILLEIDGMGEATQDRLAKKLNFDQSTASRNLKNLLKKGLIKAFPSNSDKRRKILALTKKGFRRLNEYNEVAQADTRAAFEFLSLDERQMAIQGMELYANAWRSVNLQKFPDRREHYSPPSFRTIKLERVSPNAREVRELIVQLNQHNLSHYPPERCHLDSPTTLEKSDGYMVGAFAEDQLVGIGAVKFQENYGEIKRMFVPEKYRGNGISKLILDELVRMTKEQGYSLVRLETGTKFKAAMNLYRKCGFKPCPAFGPYKKSPMNYYMEREI